MSGNGRTRLLRLLLAGCFLCIGLCLYAVLTLWGGDGGTSVPFAAVPLVTGHTAAPNRAGAVDLNTAGVQQLAGLPGIGTGLAERIVEYREENGPFRYPDEIVNVRGIGWEMYEALRDRIAVN